ncbi:hypothetical protein DENIS_0900 [Desulfonema ishimotonii]|uniref:Teneurin-like YD-shell domain-containing protein n=1 Tax=Desulfonema ishimotonii TaxID=45657 RepID=A0A401FSM2_9BACT|nr:RHS repeat-associated core domain-containing protein [Desulfonema ishimotonii]GBC59958.1 hypothetical protein DENIS_0900 [Desulfonema ishimotonii]
MPVAMTKGGQRYYLAYDQVGTLRAVADASGNAVKRIQYDSFGNVISDSDTAFAVPFGFAGGLHDADTGLVRFGYRDYDPDTGRWTAKDPILFAGRDTDLYGYCLGDPVNLVDEDGRLWGEIAFAAGIAYLSKIAWDSMKTAYESARFSKELGIAADRALDNQEWEKAELYKQLQKHVAKETYDDILKIMQSIPNMSNTGPVATDNVSLWSVEFMSRLLAKINESKAKPCQAD